jgi:hypothetical protein
MGPAICNKCTWSRLITGADPRTAIPTERGGQMGPAVLVAAAESVLEAQTPQNVALPRNDVPVNRVRSSICGIKPLATFLYEST